MRGMHEECTLRWGRLLCRSGGSALRRRVRLLLRLRRRRRRRLGRRRRRPHGLRHLRVRLLQRRVLPRRLLRGRASGGGPLLLLLLPLQLLLLPLLPLLLVLLLGRLRGVSGCFVALRNRHRLRDALPHAPKAHRSRLVTLCTRMCVPA